jgi:hypothetical protein
MRTTVTLDPELVTRAKQLALKRRTSFKAVLNDALRRGLAAPERVRGRARFAVEPVASGFRPGVDPAKLDQLLDQLEVEDFSREAGRQ